jgi:hypothetical protein
MALRDAPEPLRTRRPRRARHTAAATSRAALTARANTAEAAAPDSTLSAQFKSSGPIRDAGAPAL